MSLISDATDTHGNMHMDQGLLQWKTYLLHYDVECITANFSVNIITELLGLIMRNNIFKFGDIWWV